ncbi:hypothetical protein MKZ38_009055 [Zalerion maritima]|uniref:Uncharacterized protein n=1 Tax=Zalerion maritima TaxID=339359 RepID=A0AAD5RUX9_9PEZI|nr:hypothetical protein MKZ38_009055 [Zalerion maritima]
MKLTNLWNTALRTGLGRRFGIYPFNPTDTLSEQNLAASGYLENHGIDPAILPSFIQTWAFDLPTTPLGSEQFHAKPLVYGPSDSGQQNVYLFSEQNGAYILDATNGTVIKKKQYYSWGEVPFMSQNLTGTCPDSFWGPVGITGTPVIDPDTNTIFFWSKGTVATLTTGEVEGIYRFYAVDALTLEEKTGFPIDIDGIFAQNDPNETFNSALLVQRSALKMVDDVVYAEFSSDCDDSSNDGWLVGIRTTNGEPAAAVSTNSGVWNSGAPFVFDGGNRLFLAGSKSLMAFNSNEGNLTFKSSWNPYVDKSLFGGRAEHSSFSLSLLPFSTPIVKNILLAVDRSGKFASFNADKLGEPEAALQTFGVPDGGSLGPGGIATYPLEGGYVYYTAPGGKTYAYHFGTNEDFNPRFNIDGSTLEMATGDASMVVTSRGGRDGTGVVWVSDISGLRAYRAIPENGKLIKIGLPPMPAPAKFQLPVFGNNVYFIMTNEGLAAFASDPDIPFLCDGPINFGTLRAGEYRIANASCFTRRPVDTIDALDVGNKYFMADIESLPKGSLNAGLSFSFPIMFQLPPLDPSEMRTSGNRSVVRYGWNTTDFRWNTTAGRRRLEDPELAPGLHTGTIGICAAEGRMSGIGVSARARTVAPFVAVSPSNVTFAPFHILPQRGPSHGTFRIENRGDDMMEILGFGHTTNLATGWANATMDADGKWVLDQAGTFKAPKLPIGGLVPGNNGAVLVDVEFSSTEPGDYLSIISVYTSGGTGYVVLLGNADTAPWAIVETSEDLSNFTKIDDCNSRAGVCNVTIDLGESTGPGYPAPFTNLRVMNAGSYSISVVDATWGGDSNIIAPILGAVNKNTTILPYGNVMEAIVFSPNGTATTNGSNVVYEATLALELSDQGWGRQNMHFIGTLVETITPTPTPGLLSNSTANATAAAAAATNATFVEDKNEEIWSRMFSP